MIKNKKIVVGLSGGIDSSISMLLLKKQGWNPIGVSLKLPVWSFNKAQDKKYLNAKKVCQILKTPHYILDVEEKFKNTVVDYFVSEFKNNKTPNPCIVCNRILKFNKLFEFAKKHRIKYVATGHYALVSKRQTPVSQQGGPNTKLQTYQLLKAKDKTKDQTYNLCFLPKKWLKYIVFPLGNYTKKQVYKIAEKQGFDFLTKIKSSQDFCYLSNTSVDNFLKIKLGKKPGNIVDCQGKILGKHRGLHFYTIGQRKGIKISGGPYFVKSFDLKKNLVIVTKVQKEIEQKEVFLSPFNFISIKAPIKKIEVMARVRYRQPLSKAYLYPPNPLIKNRLRLVFEKPQRAVTKGQYAVFYKKSVCLGGGRIN